MAASPTPQVCVFNCPLFADEILSYLPNYRDRVHVGGSTKSLRETVLAAEKIRLTNEILECAKWILDKQLTPSLPDMGDRAALNTLFSQCSCITDVDKTRLRYINLIATNLLNVTKENLEKPYPNHTEFSHEVFKAANLCKQAESLLLNGYKRQYLEITDIHEFTLIIFKLARGPRQYDRALHYTQFIPLKLVEHKLRLSLAAESERRGVLLESGDSLKIIEEAFSTIAWRGNKDPRTSYQALISFAMTVLMPSPLSEALVDKAIKALDLIPKIIPNIESLDDNMYPVLLFSRTAHEEYLQVRDSAMRAKQERTNAVL